MNKRTMNGQMIEEFGSYLENEEKSPATLEKYLRDVRAFWHFAGEQHVTRELVRRWKDFLVERKYGRPFCQFHAGQRQQFSGLGRL